jgi:tetratricopeptide (TPR) repeat protein
MALSSLFITGCSTEKNTAKSRWWHSFNTRYNTYYNGKVAYIEGSLEKENGNKDNFTEIIPLYTVGNKDSRTLGKGNFDRAIEKAEKAIKLHSIKRRPVWNKRGRKTERDIEWLGRKEYNPFLWKVWMLMGRAQFHQGDFDAAASTFNYMARLYETQPAIYGRARAWLAKSYIENDFLYDAEDVIRNMQRDSIHWRAQKEWDYTLANYYIHTQEYEQAIPYLRKVIKHEMRKKQKAREYFLLGQLEAALGRNPEAYKSFQKAIRQNPPYELEFNARIAQTEVMAGGQAKKMIARLKRMAVSDKNKDYLEQVYYAIGNIYLAQRDTMKAIANYEQGNEKATRNGIEKGVLLLKLGDLYWVKEKYNDAQRCYGEAIGLLDKERKDYEMLSMRSKVLDELVPFTDAVQLQDSLQTLAKMSEHDRNAAIDRVIAALKKKEKEEKDRLAEENAQQVMQRNRATGNSNRTPTRPVPGAQQQNGAWYFYNPMAVQQGKQQFQRMWGKRENVDNWQRVNTTVVDMPGEMGGIADLTDEQQDSIARAEAVADSLEQIADSAQNDPHRREYYLAQIPFTEDQIKSSNLVIMDGLYNSGVIFKDKLDNLTLGEKALVRLVSQYPTYEKMDEAYYHLFLLYSRKGESQLAESYIDRLKSEFPESQWTQVLTDPYFSQNAREGVHIEDSLYAATYDAFKADRYMEVWGNAKVSEKRFPLGANRDKFLFIGGLSKLNSGDGDGCLADMKILVEKFPQSGLAEMAGMIINGVKEGRRLRGGKFDLGDVWTRRSVVLSDSDSINARTLSNERNTNFVFMLVYQPDSVDRNKLLFELAKYNFTSYLVRDFNINVEEGDGVDRMMVSGFLNYDEALQYARQLLQQENVALPIGKARPVIISEENLPLLGTNFSYDEYSKFYTKHFAPLKISTFHLLSEPADITIQPTGESDEPITESDIDNFLNNTIIIPEDIERPAETVIPVEGEPIVEPTDIPTGTTVVPVEGTPTEQTGTTVTPTEGTPTEQTGTTTIPVEEPTSAPTGTTVIPIDSVPELTPTVPNRTNRTRPVSSTRPTTPVTPTKTTTPTRRVQPNIINGAEIIFDNVDSIPPSKARPRSAAKRTGTADKNSTNKPQPNNGKAANKQKQTDTRKKTEKKTTTFDLEDEYYDLEGF